MKILTELELRRSILLELREKYSLSSRPFYRDKIKNIDIFLFNLDCQIKKVHENKLFFANNLNAFLSDFEYLDFFIDDCYEDFN